MKRIKNYIRAVTLALCLCSFMVPMPTSAGIEDWVKVERSRRHKKHRGGRGGGGGTVYICNGPYASKYHSSSWCRGLNRCSASISSTSKSKAQSMGFSACMICY